MGETVDIVAAIKQIHTYEVPEIVQVPIVGGLAEYLGWIDDCTGGDEIKQCCILQK
jgi:uncharacterized protein involved in tolerance to divalent cations